MIYRSIMLLRIWFWIACAVQAAWIWYTLRSAPGSRASPLLVGSIGFLLIYLFPIALLGAKLEVKEDGLHVEQYSSSVLPYTDVRRCVSFFLFPGQFLIVFTKRPFPLSILISGDTLDHPRRSFFDDGKLAQAIKASLQARDMPTKP